MCHYFTLVGAHAVPVPQWGTFARRRPGAGAAGGLGVWDPEGLYDGLVCAADERFNCDLYDVVAALSVAVNAARITMEQLEVDFLPALRTTAAQITELT